MLLNMTMSEMRQRREEYNKDTIKCVNVMKYKYEESYLAHN